MLRYKVHNAVTRLLTDCATSWLCFLRALDDAQSANDMGLFTVVHDGTCVFGSLRAAFSKLNIPAVDAK